MRWTGLVLAISVLAAAGTALAGHQGCVGCGGHGYRGMDAEPGAFPCGYALVPGCCEDTRHCCDNAWAGYCEHRAKVDAFWYRVGAPGHCDRGNYGRPVTVLPSQTCEPNIEPLQPSPPRPASQPTPPAPMPRTDAKAAP